MKTTISVFLIPLFILVTLAVPSSSPAQTSTVETEAARMDSLAVSQGQGKVAGRISSDFSSFLGSNSETVVTGLRNGQWTYPTAGSTGTGTPTTTTVALPTGKMGYGNVYISLALAKQQLSYYGITQPTQGQLQAALLGGSITTVNGTTTTNYQIQGVLTMRSQGMGWGQIAHELGYKLGPVISGMRSSNQALLTSTSTGSGTVNAGGQPIGSTSSGIVTGSGKSVQRHGKGVSETAVSGQGIVTGSGRSVTGTTSGIVTGRGHAYGVVEGDPSGAGGYGKGHTK